MQILKIPIESILSKNNLIGKIKNYRVTANGGYSRIVSAIGYNGDVYDFDIDGNVTKITIRVATSITTTRTQ